MAQKSTHELTGRYLLFCPTYTALGQSRQSEPCQRTRNEHNIVSFKVKVMSKQSIKLKY